MLPGAAIAPCTPHSRDACHLTCRTHAAGGFLFLIRNPIPVTAIDLAATVNPNRPSVFRLEDTPLWKVQIPLRTSGRFQAGSVAAAASQQCLLCLSNQRLQLLDVSASFISGCIQPDPHSSKTHPPRSLQSGPDRIRLVPIFWHQCLISEGVIRPCRANQQCSNACQPCISLH